MAQGDMNIANQGFPAFRADLNDQLEALVTNSSGATAPATTFPHQWWLDTSTTPSTLRQRNAANDAWIVVGLLNQSTNTFNVPVAQGGTGAGTFTNNAYLKGAGTNAITAQEGIPAGDITSGTLTVARGGTGRSSLTSNNVILGAGTSAVNFVAPGTSGNVLTSNGTTWTSAASPAPTIASTAEAQAGTNNTKFITPLRMREGFNASGSAPVYACRAWVNFNGTGTVAIRASGNVSSITDNGTGAYTINLTTAMPDANYAISGAAGISSGDVSNRVISAFPNTSSSVGVAVTRTSDGAVQDVAFCSVEIFR
jgi:hypothetical protein